MPTIGEDVIGPGPGWHRRTKRLLKFKRLKANSVFGASAYLLLVLLFVFGHI